MHSISQHLHYSKLLNMGHGMNFGLAGGRSRRHRRQSGRGGSLAGQDWRRLAINQSGG